VKLVNLSEMRLSDDVIAAIPRHVAKRYKVVPVYRNNGSITVALSDPAIWILLTVLHHLLNQEIQVTGGD